MSTAAKQIQELKDALLELTGKKTIETEATPEEVEEVIRKIKRMGRGDDLKDTVDMYLNAGYCHKCALMKAKKLW